MQRVITGFATAVMIMFSVALPTSVGASSANGTDITVVTINPNMPDDFLNLYPELDGNEIAELPNTGASPESYAGPGLFLVGAAAVAIAAITARRRRTGPLD